MRTARPHQHRRQTRGSAIIITLALILLASALIIGFLLRVFSEQVTADNFSSAVRTRLLTNMVVNLVQAQINEATSQDTSNVWTSQPGLIRVYKSGEELDQAYLLYSSSRLTTNNITDLNSDLPSSGWENYPALWVDLNAPIKVWSGTRYPILDASVFNLPATQKPLGLNVDSAPVASGTNPNPLPMPVRWLYVLKDGSLCAPVAGDSANQVKIDKETTGNPVVGRIAFWTDDETCKININTACGDELNAPVGSFWDTPRVTTQPEKINYSDRLPVQNEFQRFPGHPATVYLAEALPDLTRTQLTSLAPRIKNGGSEGGTKAGSVAINLNQGNGTDSGNDRLYASIGEMFFDPSRNINNSITPERLEQVKFLLTANSRAPEVNMFNMPRISMWPIDRRGDAYLTVFDKLIRRCSTINGICYYFQRSQSQDSTIDATANEPLYNYLDYLTRQNFLTGNFSSKYSTSIRQQLLVEMLDYIRCTNLDDTLQPDTSKRFAYSDINSPGLGHVFPLKMNGYMGFGRFYTLSEAGLIFADEAEKFGTTSRSKDTANIPIPTTANRKVIQCAFVMEAFCVAAGYPYIGMNTTWTVEGLENLQIRDSSGNFVSLFSPGIRSSTLQRSARGNSSRKWGSVTDIRNFSETTPYKFLGNYITINTNSSGAGTMDFQSTGNVVIKIYGGASATGTPVQTINLNFPAATFLQPTISPSDTSGTSVKSLAVRTTYNANDLSNSNDAYKWIGARDTVRSLVPTGNNIQGDIREVARREVVDNTVFQPHNDYSISGTSFAHGFQFGDRTGMQGRREGNLAPISGSYGLYNPKFPKGQPSVSTGDFDNGPGSMPDGPFINKPDEGAVKNGASNYYGQYGLDELSDTYFSPNREIPSPGMFGSLPVGPWRTLLFRPQSGHPDAGDPRDYLLMDLFWMPVVQPFAISEPFSTSGKINLNTRIYPFTFIERNTALRACLQGEKILTIPGSQAQNYKVITDDTSTFINTDFRQPVDIDYVMQQIDDREVTQDKAFTSPSQICDIELARIDWTQYPLSGDNTRERPYTTIYQKLTTKSNTYTIHFYVQALLRNKNQPAGIWDEIIDHVSASYRGSVCIERYIDPNNTNIPNYLTNYSTANNLGKYYKWRIISNTQFAP